MWYDDLIEKSKKSVYVDSVQDNIVTSKIITKTNNIPDKINVPIKKTLKISGSISEKKPITWNQFMSQISSNIGKATLTIPLTFDADIDVFRDAVDNANIYNDITHDKFILFNHNGQIFVLNITNDVNDTVNNMIVNGGLYAHFLADGLRELLSQNYSYYTTNYNFDYEKRIINQLKTINHKQIGHIFEHFPIGNKHYY